MTLGWLAGVLPAFAAGKPEVLVVYWGSKDCRWCTWWESTASGMETRLKEAPEFRKIVYRVVKNERLADPYTLEDFPPDVAWIHERMRRGVEKRPGRPGWVVYVDRKRVATFYGTARWDEHHLPEIRRLAALHVPD